MQPWQLSVLCFALGCSVILLIPADRLGALLASASLSTPSTGSLLSVFGSSATSAPEHVPLYSWCEPARGCGWIWGPNCPVEKISCPCFVTVRGLRLPAHIVCYVTCNDAYEGHREGDTVPMPPCAGDPSIFAPHT